MPDGDRTLTTRVLQERILILAWGSALLLHVAEPRIAQGVAEHSIFLSDPSRRMDRLLSTADTMLKLLLGSPDDVGAAADRINGIHDRVHGRLREAHPLRLVDTSYSAHDAELLAWVHVALHVTLLRAFEALVEPFTELERDSYCRGVACVGPLLGIPERLLPGDAATLRAFFAAGLDQLSVGEQASQV